MAEKKKTLQTTPPQVDSKEIEAKKDPSEAEVEPIKPGDQRVSKRSSLLDTCYPTSTGKK